MYQTDQILFDNHKFKRLNMALMIRSLNLDSYNSYAPMILCLALGLIGNNFGIYIFANF